MEKVQLTKEFSLSRIIQGLWHITDWNMTTAQHSEFIKACIELGVTSFDIAEIYGGYEGEACFGEVLKLDPFLRSKIQIITKTGINMRHPSRPYSISHYDTSYDKIIWSCHESLRKLNTDVIDLCLVHREDWYKIYISSGDKSLR